MMTDKDELIPPTTPGEKFKNKIEGAAKVNFWISSCPLPLFEEFKAIANKEFADTYHLALRYMLDNYKAHHSQSAESEAMWGVIRQLAKRIDDLELSLMETATPKVTVVSKKPKVFGKTKTDLEEDKND